MFPTLRTRQGTSAPFRTRSRAPARSRPFGRIDIKPRPPHSGMVAACLYPALIGGSLLDFHHHLDFNRRVERQAGGADG